METDAPVVPAGPPVPSPKPAKAKELNEPCLVDEAGMRKWSNDILKGHPGDHVMSWEQWGNSFQGSCHHFGSVIENPRGLLHQDVC